VAREDHVSPHPLHHPPLGRSSVWCLFLAVDLELVWTKGHGKLGVGVTQESHTELWYEFPMGSQGHSKHREEKADRDKEQAGGTRGDAFE
jgi:hypothetical protein